MRLIEGPAVQLPYPPKACVVTNRIDGDFVDFQVSIDRPEGTRLYLKREVVEDAGRLVGMVPASEVEEVRQGMETLTRELAEVRETADLTTQLEQKLTAKEPVPCP